MTWKVKHYAFSKPTWLVSSSQAPAKKRAFATGVKKYTSTQKIRLERVTQ